MIQKPPKFTGTVDLDDEDVAAEHDPAELAHEEELPESGHAAAHELGPDEFTDEGDDFDLDAAAQKARQRGMLIFYAGAAIGILILGLVGYHQFAPMFHHQTVTAGPVKPPVATQPAPRLAANGSNALPAPALNQPAGLNAGAFPPPAMPGNPGAAPGGIAPAGMPGNPSLLSGPGQPQMAQGQGQSGPLPNPMPGRMPAPAGAVNNAMPGSGPSLPGGAMPMPGMPPVNAQAGGIPGGLPNQASGMPQPAMAMGPGPGMGLPNGTNPGMTAGKPVLPAGTSNAPVALPPAMAAKAGPAATDAAVLPGAAPLPGGAPLPKPASIPGMAPLPTSVSGSDPRVDDLAGKVANLQASQKVTTAQLQQIQASLDMLSKQLGQVSVTPTHGAAPAPTMVPAAPAKTVAVPHHVHHEAAPVEAAASPGSHSYSSNWVLRSATPGGALLGHASTGELQRVAVGDMVTGLGRITYIGEKNGRWVVQGANGSVGE